MEGEDLGDPAPPPPNASRDLVKDYSEEVNAYATAMINCFESDAIVRGEELWFDFTSNFRTASIRALSGTQKSRWVNFLRSRGVFVRKKRGYSRNRALLECLKAKDFPCYEVRIPEDKDADEPTENPALVHNNAEDEPDMNGNGSRNVHFPRQDSRDVPSSPFNASDANARALRIVPVPPPVVESA